MGGQTVDLGPWPGGLNLLEDPRAISDQQLVTCLNFNIGRAGEVSVRAGVKNGAALGGVSSTVGAVTLPTGYTRFFTRRTDVSPNTVAYTDDATSFTTVTTTTADQVSVVVQHVGVVNTADALIPYAWFIPRGSAATGGGWRMRLDTNAESNVAGIPRGSGGVIFKERLFVWGPLTRGGAGTYRVYYSAVGDFTNWPANNFFDVNPGDGDFVQAIAVQGDSLIIFKTTSTWALYFDSDPFLGTLRRVNSEIGATGTHAVGTYQNEVYVISRNSIYRMVNLLFEDIGKSLNLIGIRGGVDFSVMRDTFSAVANRPIFRVAVGSTYRWFVYNYDARAWSEYTFSTGAKPDMFIPFVNATRSEQYLSTRDTVSGILDYRPTNNTAGNFGDNSNVGVAGTTSATLVTKEYSWGSPADFKRMFWWALECYTTRGATLITSCTVDDSTTTGNNTLILNTFRRSVVKCGGRSRFRYVQFYIDASTTSKDLTIFGGQVNTAEKAKVRNSVNS